MRGRLRGSEALTRRAPLWFAVWSVVMTTDRFATILARRALLAGLAGAAVATNIARAQVTAPSPAPVQPRPQPRAAPQGPAVTPPPGGAAPNSAAGAAPAAPSSDQPEVARVEQYLNSIRTLRARFVQVSNDGTARGTFYLSRPGKLRLEYEAPVTVLLIANGGMLQQYDTRLGQGSYVALDSTPAGLLVAEQIRLSGAVTVVAVQRSGDQLDVALIKTRDPRAGRITFSFQAQPLQLARWSLVDGQGRMTRVTLEQVQVGIPLDNTLFQFVV
jgi:outer membrane lipoprotein-sorting protein